MLMNSGPFTMEPWTDTNGNGLAEPGEPGVQEIVVGFMVAQGTNARNSVTQLKRADESAQLAFDINFELPPPPPVPNATVSNQNGEVIITWEGNAETYLEFDQVIRDEDGNPTTYTFQGYNIYQVNTPVVGPNTQILKISTFDIPDGVGDIQDQVFSSEFGEQVTATVQRASDTGLQRYFRVSTDALNGNVPIRNWQTFWYVVTAYGYNPAGIPKILESPFQTIEIQPQPTPGGIVGQKDFGGLVAAFRPDTVLNAQHVGPSDGQLEVYVIDPTKVAAANYQVSFEFDSTLGQTVWNLDRMDGGSATRLLSRQTNQLGDEAYTVVDGLQIKSIGPPNSIKSFQVVANAAGPLDPPEIGTFAFNANGFPFLDGADRPDATRQQTNGSTWGISAGGGDATFGAVGDGTGATFLDRVLRGSNASRAIPYDFEMRFTGTEGNFGYWGRFIAGGQTGPVPFELWNTGVNTPDDPSDDYRMVPWILDEDVFDNVYNYGTTVVDTSTGQINGLDHGLSGGADDPYLDWVYWADPADRSPGTAGYDAFVADPNYDSGSDSEVLARTVLVNWNGGSVTNVAFPDSVDALLPEQGTVFRIITTKPNTSSDVFTFSTTGSEATVNNQLAEDLLKNINVFPNPYFGQNRSEITPVNRFVTFTHLPPDRSDLVIRIFSLAGDLVAVIDPADREADGTSGTQTATWDLRNEESVPVASGMYIAHVDMGEKGSKVLKLAIMAPEERLDKF
jgi:hypothetical protein